MGHGRLLERVACDCRFKGDSGILAVRQFFYDRYSRCIEGSVFDGLCMILVSFTLEFMVCGSRDDKDGATMRWINVAWDAMERLVEMMN